jgi:hypothetical protein
VEPDSPALRREPAERFLESAVDPTRGARAPYRESLAEPSIRAARQLRAAAATVGAIDVVGSAAEV